MKKILVACIGTNLGGIEKSLIEFLRYLDTQDCEIDLIHWKKPGELFDQIPQSVNLLPRLAPMGISDIKKLRNPCEIVRALAWYFLLQLCKRLQKPWLCFKSLKKHYDVAISYCQNGDSPYYIIDKVEAEKKYLWYHHGSYEGTEKAYQRDLKYFSKFSKVIAVSEPCREMLQAKFPECNISSVHNIINSDSILVSANDPVDDMEATSKWKLVTVGRYAYEKGIDIAIKAAEEIKAAGVDFCWFFIGDGEYRENVEKMIRELKLEKECVLIGNRKNPYPYIKNADIYVQPSRVESFGISIVEALVLEKAIVATDIPAIMSVTEGGKYAKCVDMDKLANAIIEVCSSSEEYSRLLHLAKRAKVDNKTAHQAIQQLIGL